MDLRQLSYLAAVADHGSFTAAAKALHTVQSNVSGHLARLEKELGVELIDRSTGQPTAEGRVVIERTRRIQSELNAIAADVQSSRTEVTGTVRIGLIGTTARWLVPRLITAMNERHPRVTVEVLDATTASLVLQLNTGAIDLAVLTIPTNDPNVVTSPLFTEDRLLAAPLTHPLARVRYITLADLDGVPLIVEPSGRPFRAQLERLFEDNGYTLGIAAEVDGTRLVASLAFEGFGAAILPASAVSNRPGLGWHVVPVEGLPGRTVGIGTRRQALLSAPAIALREMLRMVITERAADQPGIHPHHVTDR